MASPAVLRFIVTTVVRRAGQSQASGFVRVVEAPTGRILMTSAVPESTHRSEDPNPFGGLRGARGVAVWRDRLVIANTECLTIFDSAWTRVGTITDAAMGSVHDILAEEDGIWIACTGADTLLKVDWNGRALERWEWRSDPVLVRELGLGKLPPIERGLDHRDPRSARLGTWNTVHLNSMARCPEGLLLSFGRILSRRTYWRKALGQRLGVAARRLGLGRSVRRSSERQRTEQDGSLPVAGSLVRGSSSAIVLLRETGTTEVIQRHANVSVPNHNVLQVGDSLVYNDSNANQLVACSRNREEDARLVTVPGSPGFNRGLAHLGGLDFLVGSQFPAAVHAIDLDELRAHSEYVLNGEANESVYGVCLLPDEFNDPPAALF